MINLISKLVSYFSHKNDELHFPSEEEVEQYTKRLRDQRKAEELEWAEEGVPLIKKRIVEYALRGENHFCVTNGPAAHKMFYALKCSWDEIEEWGKQEGVILSKNEHNYARFQDIWVSWERIK